MGSVFAAGAVVPALATDVGVSINIAQPGLYGRIDIGAVPPQLIYAQPVVIQPAYVAEPPPPVYLHVPPGHERHWARHCREYNACGVPVYFVQDGWYRQNYGRRDGDEHHGRGEGRGHDGEGDRGHGHRHDD
ncbi:MAG: hypothetical protein KGI67_15045 [Pseudomonadota bacterium]|nr:hypothetical protein [Pseudomonadota bacterium]